MKLDRAPAGHPLAGIHGHTFTLRLHLSAPLDQVYGWAMDFSDVKLLFDPIFKAMDHHLLHELAGPAGFRHGQPGGLVYCSRPRRAAAAPGARRPVRDPWQRSDRQPWSVRGAWIPA